MAIFYALIFKPDVIYLSEPSACPMGIILKKLNFNIIYHEHDYPEALLTNRKSFSMKIILQARRMLAKKVVCILPNFNRKRLFSLEINKSEAEVFSVWNCPLRSSAKEVKKTQQKDFRLVYIGSINPIRLPLEVLYALKMIQSQVRLKFMGYETLGSLGYITQFMNIAEKLGIKHNVDYLNPDFSKGRFELLREADIGISLMPIKSNNINEQYMVGASNKAFEYLSSGVPLLVSNITEWVENYVDQGYAIACDPGNPKSIAAAIQWYIHHPVERRNMGELGRMRIIEDWNYENQFESIYRTIENIATSRKLWPPINV